MRIVIQSMAAKANGLILSLFFTVFSISSAVAQNDTFTATGFGEWNDPATWIKTIDNGGANTYPQAGDDAIIDGNSAFVFTSNATGSAIARSLEIKNNGIFRVLGTAPKSLTLSSFIKISSGGGAGVLIASGNTLTAANFLMTAGFVNVSGTLTLTSGDLSISNAAIVADGANVGGTGKGVINVNNGNINVNSGGSLTLQNNGSLYANTSLGTLNVNTGGSLLINAQTYASIKSFLTQPGATSITLNGLIDLNGGTWTNAGAVSGIAGNVYNFSSLANSATISLSGILNGPATSSDGGLTFTQGVNNSTLDASAAGSTITATGAAVIRVKGSSGDTFKCGSNTFNNSGSSTLYFYGTSTLNGGTGTDFDNINVSSGTLTLTSSSGTNLIYGTLTIGSSTTANVASGSIWDFTNSGTPLSNAGIFAISTGGQAEFASLTNSKDINNDGMVSISSSFIDNGTSFVSGGSSAIDFNGSSAMTIGGTNASTFQDFIHSGNGSLNIDATYPTYSFTVKGDYNNTGSGAGDFSTTSSATAATGTVTLAGTAGSNLLDGGSGGTTFYNLTIGAGAKYKMTDDNNLNSNQVNLVNVFTITDAAGSFDADGANDKQLFTIKSTSTTATGAIAALPNSANLTGNMTIERFYPGFGTRRWQYLAFPFSSSVFVSDLQASGSFKVNGHWTSGSSGLVNESMFRFIPGVNNEYWDGIGWGGGATSAYALLNNVGYVALAYDDNTSATISLRGIPAKGSLDNHVAVDATGATKYNLIPNPYPAPLNFVALQAANSGLIGTTVEVETNNASPGQGIATTTATATYTTAGVCTNCSGAWGTWNGTIAAGQSFWVTATGTGNLSYTESMKSAGSATYIGRTEQENAKDYIRITLISGNMKDEAAVLFRDGAKETFNIVNDAKKRLSGDPVEGTGFRTYVNVGTLKSDTPDPLVFNFSPLVDCQTGAKIIKLFVQVTESGTHTLKFTDLETFTLGYSIALNDKHLSKQIAVNNGTQYSFSTTDLASTYGTERFELVFSPKELTVPSVVLKGTEFTTVDAPVIQWYKDGKAIDGATKKTFVATESGSYSVNTGYSSVCTKSSLPVVLVITSLNKEDNSYLVYPNPGEGFYTLTIPISVVNREIKLTDSKGVEVNADIKVSSEGSLVSFDLSSYSAGVYIVKIKENSNYRFVKVIKK